MGFRKEDLTDEDFQEQVEEHGEYLEEYLERDEEIEDMGIDEFEENRSVKDYGLCDDELPDDD
ncbi:MAG: hypothetical protein VB076_03185 [Synergistaceae bacterium]|nr:hypothetical protein [Synergistaceae bacterium]